MRRLGKRGGVGLLAIVVTGMTLWGMGALSYAALPALLHSVLAATCGLACRRPQPAGEQHDVLRAAKESNDDAPSQTHHPGQRTWDAHVRAQATRGEGHHA